MGRLEVNRVLTRPQIYTGAGSSSVPTSDHVFGLLNYTRVIHGEELTLIALKGGCRPVRVSESCG